MKHQFIIILLLFLSFTAIAEKKKGQARIDSLVAELAKTKTDTSKVKLLVSISYSSEYTDPPKSLQWGMQALDLAKKIRWKKGLFEANIQVGFVYGAMGNIEKADAHCSEGLAIAKDLQNDELLMKAYECMGMVSDWKSDYTKAIAYFYDCIRLAEKLKNKIYVANSYSNMTSIYCN